MRNRRPSGPGPTNRRFAEIETPSGIVRRPQIRDVGTKIWLDDMAHAPDIIVLADLPWLRPGEQVWVQIPNDAGVGTSRISLVRVQESGLAFGYGGETYGAVERHVVGYEVEAPARMRDELHIAAQALHPSLDVPIRHDAATHIYVAETDGSWPERPALSVLADLAHLQPGDPVDLTSLAPGSMGAREHMRVLDNVPVVGVDSTGRYVRYGQIRRLILLEVSDA